MNVVRKDGDTPGQGQAAAQEAPSHLELSQRDKRFQQTIIKLAEIVRKNGDTQHAETLLGGLGRALEVFQNQAKSGVPSIGLRGLWLLENQTQAAPEVLKSLLRAIELAVESENIALRDELTGLLNRRAFNQRFQVLLEEHHRKDQDFSLVLIDLNGLKSVNDQMGHPQGDRAIRALGKTLSQNIREEAGDQAYRFGGDEFALLVVADEQGAQAVVQRVLQAIQHMNTFGGRRKGDTQSLGYDIEVSTGMVSASAFPDGKRTLEGMYAAADEALYAMKSQRKEVSSEPRDAVAQEP